MKSMRALCSGAAGAITLTVLHETARRVTPHAPRMDVMGMRAITRMLRWIGRTPPPDERLHKMALIGDLVSNSLYYSSVTAGDPQRIWVRGITLGLLSGMGAAFLPRPLELGEQPNERKPLTQILTVIWYLAGGLAAAAAASALAASNDA